MKFIASVGPGFLGLQLYHALRVIDEQGDAALDEIGLDLPSRLSSTLIALKRYGPMSAADISRLLDLPHQLTAQRIRHLRERRLIREERDPADRRRIIITLSDKGADQAEALDRFAEEIGRVYEAVFEEIGADLHAAIAAFQRALTAKPLSERHNELFGEAVKKALKNG
ncbi:MAG: MarR family transcriptional regulator [Pseudomonadota bacterium]